MTDVTHSCWPSMWTTVDSLAQAVDTEYLSTVPTVMLYPQHTHNTRQLLQQVQLSQRPRCSLQGGLVMAKSGRLELGDNIYEHCRSIFNNCDVIGQQSNQNW